MGEFTKVSSKGQVVIPQDIRESLHLKEGTPLVVIMQKDSILLKKIELPKVESWDEAALPFRKAAKRSRFTKGELEKLIEETRRSVHG